MTTTVTIIARAAALAGALGLGAAPVLAQGTAEQREACAPDAIRLCADTIPDVGRTTACMASHRAELSRRCRMAFDAGAPKAAPRTRIVHSTQAAPPRPRVAVGAPPRHARAAALAHRHGGSRDTREARRVIGRMCGAGLVDADTCGFMGRVLTLAE